MKVRLLAFAGLRELLGAPAREIEVREGASLGDLWTQLIRERPEFAALEQSSRFARNGALAGRETLLAEGDEVALMPPFGGG
jgi:molybdopterin converting factor small subunit